MVIEADGKSERRDIGDIREIKLTYAPSRTRHRRYQMKVLWKAAPMNIVLNESYESVASFSHDDAGYRSFVEDLHAALAEIGSKARFRSGSTWPAYLGMGAFLLTVFGFLAFVMPLMLKGYGSSGNWFRLLLIAVLLPTLALYFYRNRPASYDPANLPQDVLPAP